MPHRATSVSGPIAALGAHLELVPGPQRPAREPDPHTHPCRRDREASGTRGPPRRATNACRRDRQPTSAPARYGPGQLSPGRHEA